MKFLIDPSMINLFPSVKIGVLVFRGLDNHADHKSAIAAQLRQAEEKVRSSYTLETLSSQPKIVDWREAYRKFGFKPSSHRSSVEALTRRVLQGKDLPSINNLVDLYNLVSIKHLFPIGADDLDHVKGDIRLTVANGTERFLMLGSQENEPIKNGEVVYRDDEEVLCRSWNYRECEKTKITETTKNVCLVIEGLEHSSKEEILAALKDLRSLISHYCHGNCQEFFLNSEHTEITI